MLNDLHLNYNHFYKIINKNNISSIRVAEKCGFTLECETKKSRFLHTISKVEHGDQYLYSKLNNKDITLLRQAIARDVESIEFVEQYARETAGAKNALEKMQNGGASI